MNDGLNITKLRRLQPTVTQLGFLLLQHLVPSDKSYTVIEVEMLVEHIESMIEQGLAIRQPIVNVAFQGEQIWFHPDTFEFINRNSLLRPFSGEI